MEKSYLKLPLNFSELLQKKELKTCALEYSIAQNILLIIVTAFGECRFDHSFGCEIWDLDFELIYNPNTWREAVQKSLQNSIEKHEKRLSQVKVSVELSEEQVELGVVEARSLKQKLTIKISGNLTATNQPFFVNKTLYLNPISYAD